MAERDTSMMEKGNGSAVELSAHSELGSLFQRYGLAVLCAAGAVAVRWMLDPVLGNRMFLTPIYGFVALTVWRAGWGPALITAFLGYVAVNWLFLEPRSAFGTGISHLWSLITYLFSVLAIVGFGEAMRRARHQARCSAALALEQRRHLQVEVQERKQAEDALRESENRLRLALAAGRMGAWDVDMETGRMNWDAQEYALLGWPDGEGVPSLEQFYSRVHPDDRHRVQQAIAHALLEAGELGQEFRIVRPDGTIRWLAEKGLTLNDDRGHPRRRVGIHYDMTERKVVEEQLRWSAHELETRVAHRTGELVQSQARLRALANELNLAEQRERIRLATDLHDHLQQLLVLGKLKLGQGKGAESVPPCIRVMEEVDDLLTQSLTYTRTLVAELSPPVLRDHGLAAGLKWLGEYMKKHDMVVTVVVPEEDGVQLPKEQAVLLFQCVRELLMNSWKYADTGRASVRMSRRDACLCIEVSDEGRGFDWCASEAVHPVSGSSTKFGLFSIRERMTALGGACAIVSASGKGTQATLTLPLAPKRAIDESRTMSDELKTTAPRRPSLVTHHPSRIRVLLVDDHAMVRQGLKTMLEAYTDVEVVAEASDGEEALTAAEHHRPTVVVMDLNMPKMNGLEATARLKARYPDLAIIGLSINAGRENQDAMKKAGGAVLLTKEAAVDELYRTIQRALEPSAA
jgi:PAS domain S-box-containing protein